VTCRHPLLLLLLPLLLLVMASRAAELQARGTDWQLPVNHWLETDNPWCSSSSSRGRMLLPAAVAGTSSSSQQLQPGQGLSTWLQLLQPWTLSWLLLCAQALQVTQTAAAADNDKAAVVTAAMRLRKLCSRWLQAVGTRVAMCQGFWCLRLLAVVSKLLGRQRPV
jgi:hypothetical protein